MSVITPGDSRVRASLADVLHAPFWTDRTDRPASHPPLEKPTTAELLVIGAGFTGLWTAICAKQEEPERDVLLVDASTIAHGGTGRNGGFISASLTHGLAHGEALWPTEMDVLTRMGRENLADIVTFTRTHDINADLHLVGKTAIATTQHARAELPAMLGIHRRWDEDAELLDQDGMRADVDSPTYLGGLRVRTGSGLMDPARLAWGLARTAHRLGVRIHENTPITHLDRIQRSSATHVTATTPIATITARHAVLATNAFTPLLRRLRYRILPIFDHVLVTEPLTDRQLDDIGWRENQGLTDIGNQFHYYRRTPDNRILWGGYDAIYHRGNRTDPALEHRDSSHVLLATQFFQTFPQLDGLRFTHKWAGLIDSTSRFTPAIGTAFGGALAYAVGYTGLGTASSRFGARTMLDLLAGRRTERTELTLVRRKPFAFPPEPLRYPLIQFTRAQLAREDATGQRGLWLRTLDRFGLGFNS